MRLPFSGALLHCLDENLEPLRNAFASGFVRREADGLWLYTCWHVVTGFDPYSIRVGLELPKRRHLRVALQASEARQPGVQVIGGLQSVVLPLYDTSAAPARPRWLQDARHIPHADLNAVGIYVPFWHDLVKIKLPPEIELSDLQIVDESLLLPGNVGLLAPGDKCMVVGYPFGFSAHGPEQPAPVALTRFLASHRIANRRQQVLLESAGAPGMSGGPVFVERGEDLFLFGIYVGLIYPDHAAGTNESLSALGVVCNLMLSLWGHLPLVETPNEAHVE